MVDGGLTELMFTSDNLWEMEHKKYHLPGGSVTETNYTSYSKVMFLNSYTMYKSY